MTDKLVKALGFTALLALGSLALSLLVSLPLAILTALKKDSPLEAFDVRQYLESL